MNVVSLVTGGRSARALLQAVSPVQLADTASQVFAAIERFENRNLPRSF